MKKYTMIVLSSFYGVIGYASCSYEIQPPLTAEMQLLELTPFPSRAQQIVDVYLIDDETWKKKLKEAKDQFELLKRQEQEGTDIKFLLPEYWNLAKNYDYGPANDELVHTFIGGEDCNVRFKSRDWSDFFSTARPTRLCDMEYLRRAYMGDKSIYLKQVGSLELDMSSDHSQQSYSSGGTTDGHLSSRKTTPPKDQESENTWHFLDLFSWFRDKSRASSPSSHERTPPDASFSSRDTTPPKDEDTTSQRLLGPAKQYVKPAEGLRRRYVAGTQQQ